jgi:hypothetical protein
LSSPVGANQVVPQDQIKQADFLSPKHQNSVTVHPSPGQHDAPSRERKISAGNEVVQAPAKENLGSSSPESQPETETELEVGVETRSDLEQPDTKSSPPPSWGKDTGEALKGQGEQNRIRMQWLQHLETEDSRGFPLENSFLRDADTQPRSEADLGALKSLDASLKALSTDQKSKPSSAAARFEALFDAYKEHTPAVIRRGGALRTAKTLEALLKAGITPEQLHRACFMSFVRDVGAQLTASTAAYTGSFFTYNALLSHLMRDKADPSVQLTLPPLAHTAASLVVARFLRAAEMGPGWTRAVEADSKGAASAALLTKPGFAKTVAQYWPFFAPLLWASLGTPDPVDAHSAAEKLDRSAERVEFRRDWGFAGSAGVALHRIFAFEREHVWLDASTEPKRLATLEAIDELTSPLKTMTSLGKYAVVRPLAGLAGLVGWDAHPVINKASEWMWGAQPAEGLGAGVESVGISGYFQKKGLSIKRACLLMLPMGAFNTARSFTNSAPDYSNLINVANDTVLIGGWGYAMAEQERSIASDDNLKKENVARATRQTMALARRARDVAPGQ